MRRKTFLVLALVVCGGGLLLVRSAGAGQKRTVGKMWPSGERIPIDRVDHTAWDLLLRKYVDADGYVNYRAWFTSSSDRQALTHYLATLSQADPRMKATRQAQLAFWINAYNATTIEGILREYPTDSIRNHTANVVGYNIWKDLLLFVGDGQYSLETIEHKILRPAKEPRIHFAIVCASVGCPRLINQAFTAANLDELLTANTRHFFADATKFRYDPQGQELHLSKILQWFPTDFGEDRAAQLKTIAPYLPDAAAQQAALSGRAAIAYLEYDWKLNDQARRQPQTRGGDTSGSRTR